MVAAEQEDVGMWSEKVWVCQGLSFLPRTVDTAQTYVDLRFLSLSSTQWVIERIVIVSHFAWPEMSSVSHFLLCSLCSRHSSADQGRRS